MADGELVNTTEVQKPVAGWQLHPGKAVRDIVAGLAAWRIWLALSWEEFRSTYRRSFFGLIWVVLAFAGFVFVKIIIFSSLLETPDATYYSAYLITGIYLWRYFSAVTNSASTTFVAAGGWIQSEPLPYSLYIFKMIMRELYNLALMFIVVVVAFMYLNFQVPLGAWMCLPAVAFFVLNAFSIKLLLGILSARYRDVDHLVQSLTMPLMFLTPIFWLPSQMEGLMKYLWWNPFFHYMEIFRAPLLTGEFPAESWIFTGCVYLGISSVAFLLFVRFRQRIVFWL